MSVCTKVLHVIPADGIGGVESAARTAAERQDGRLEVLFLTQRPAAFAGSSASPRVGYAPARNPFSARAVRAALRKKKELRPDIIVFSLWKSVVAFLVLRTVVRDCLFVLFLHSDRPVHVWDRIAIAVMARLCDAIWADSESALIGRLGKDHADRRTRVISFVLHRPAARVRANAFPRFIFWGRLNYLKRLDEAVIFFSEVAARYPAAEFVVIGPDAGCRPSLEALVDALGLPESISFVGSKTFAEIRELAEPMCFYVQFSSQEGFAMSVVEAMQLGLVPIVTPVGGIASYCHHMENAVIYQDRRSALAALEEILAADSFYESMSAAAIATWARVLIYDEDFLRAAKELKAAIAPTGMNAKDKL